MRTLNQNTLCRMEQYIKEYQTENSRSPSYRNIMHFMGMSSLNLVQRYVLALEREGRIQRTRLGNIELPSQLDMVLRKARYHTLWKAQRDSIPRKQI